jgi:murein tripeptide amidase MpaA
MDNMKRRHLIGCSAVLMALTTTAVWGQDDARRVRYDDYRVVDVQIDDTQDVRTMEALDAGLLADGVIVGGLNKYMVPPGSMDELLESDLEYDIIHQDLQLLIDRERAQIELPGRSFHETYHTYDELNAFYDNLIAAYPDFMTKEQIGTSIQGRPIWAFTLTSPVAGEKPALSFNNMAHAREWISPAMMAYIVERMLLEYGNDPSITAILDKVRFYIAPTMNPDGYIYSWDVNRMWRKTRRNNGDGTYGVDWNRNFSTGFGGPGSSGNTSDETYRGPFAFSEPETQALRDFILNHDDIVAHIDFHSYSQLILRPYGYTYDEPVDADEMQSLGEMMADAIFDVHGKVYDAEPANQLYLASGICSDWAYAEGGVFAWTYELRDTGFYGFTLPADQIIPTGEEIYEAVRVLAEYYSLLLRFEYPAGLPQLVMPDTPTPVVVAISGVNADVQGGTAKLVARINNGAWTEYDLTPAGGDLYEGELPGAACGAGIDFYFKAQTTGGTDVMSPENAPDSYYEADSVNLTIALEDNLETDLGWTVGAPDDDATTGIWERTDPQSTGAQPGDDHTPAPGTNCFVTDGRSGSSIGSYDVDDGKTTLFSPIFAAGDGETYVSYWRWYSNTQGSDPNNDVFVVDISDDGGATWFNVETVGPSGEGTNGGWFFHEFALADIAGLTPSGTMQLRFIASDENSGSIVEAAIDDIMITVIDDCDDCVGDLNGDGVIDLSDLGILLAAYEVDDGGDLDGDGDTDLADLGALLAVYGQDCP